MTVVMKLKTRSQKGFSFWHCTMWSMLSSLWQPIIRQTVGFDLSLCLLRTKVPRWSSLRQCLSSVASEIGVPSDSQTLSQGDAGVGEAVVFGVGVGPLGFAVRAEASDVRRGKVFGDVADVEVGEACDAVIGGVGGPSVRAREGLGD